MIARGNSWEPYSSRSWAKLLGMVHVPMFSSRAGSVASGDHAVLLDGARGSFAFSRSGDRQLIHQNTPLSWTWSAHVRHVVIADSRDKVLYLRRWDDPSLIRRFEVPSREQGAIEFLDVLRDAEPERAADVIQHVLYAFRLIREIQSCSDPVWAIKVFNGLLLAADAVRAGRIQRRQIEGASTIGQALCALSLPIRRQAEIEELPKSIRNQEIGVLGQYFLEPDPRTGLELHPNLLLRHASSKLYQEAHLQIERSPQLSFPGMGSTARRAGSVARDIRFTPANLARALAQQAIRALGRLPGRLVVLDPACGSGIFLQECLRELASRRYGGHARIIGYDISPVSACMSRFCLKHVAREVGGAPFKAQIEVEKDNSLRREWDAADLVLMNPPFIPFSALNLEQQEDVRATLGDVATGRVDIAMAFVAKALDCLKPNGVLGCVMPGAILHAKSALAWRERLQAQGHLLMLGRFEGYRYFPNSLVETSFLVLQRRRKGSRRRPPVELVIAREGSEDAGLRALRLPSDDPRRQAHGAEVFPVAATDISAASWRPLRQWVYECRRALMARGLPCIGSLFNIRQGVRTGDNKAFLLSAEDYMSLGKERKYFRPAAGGKTLHQGRLTRSTFVFYPYGPEGLALESEEDLRRHVPRYYSGWLKPRMDELAGRAGITRWWSLTWPRQWQFRRCPRLVSAYFGGSGSFAFDTTGRYAVVNGFAWDWRKPLPEGEPFGTTRLPWAYLALLNSSGFERVLSWFSIPLQGGQMRLEPRFLSGIPIPDFSDGAVAPDVLQDLVDLGKSVHRGKLEDVRQRLDTVVEAAYGVPLGAVDWG